MFNTSEQHNVSGGQFLPHGEARNQTHPKLRLAGDSSPKHHWVQQLGQHMVWNPRYCQTELIHYTVRGREARMVRTCKCARLFVHVYPLRLIICNSLTKYCYDDVSPHLLKISKLAFTDSGPFTAHISTIINTDFLLYFKEAALSAQQYQTSNQSCPQHNIIWQQTDQTRV